MNLATAQLESTFEQQYFQFTSGLIAGGFVFFTLLALTIVWFLKNPLLRLLLIFTTLQTVLVSYDFNFSSFGSLSFIKLILTAAFVFLLQRYLIEIKNRSQLQVINIERNSYLILIVSALPIFLWFWENVFLLKISMAIQLLYWLFLGIRIDQVLRNVRFFYRFSGFFLWFYSWLIFLINLVPINGIFNLNEYQFSQLAYLGWLGVSFFAALSLIHQVVQLNAQNIHLESEQLNLKNKLGLAQLESSENERKRIVSELHNDVLNRIDMLTMTANQNALNQDVINLNLIDSLNVLRKYTYKLYPPHTDVLSLGDIFRREAEIWSESSLNIKVTFDSAWNQIREEHKMPIFRFVEYVTFTIHKSQLFTKGIWNFNIAGGQYELRIQFFGHINKFTLSPNDYLIFKDLLSATIIEKTAEESYEISLIFNINQ